LAFLKMPVLAWYAADAVGYDIAEAGKIVARLERKVACSGAEGNFWNKQTSK